MTTNNLTPLNQLPAEEQAKIRETLAQSFPTATPEQLEEIFNSSSSVVIPEGQEEETLRALLAQDEPDLTPEQIEQAVANLKAGLEGQ